MMSSKPSYAQIFNRMQTYYLMRRPALPDPLADQIESVLILKNQTPNILELRDRVLIFMDQHELYDPAQALFALGWLVATDVLKDDQIALTLITQQVEEGNIWECVDFVYTYQLKMIHISPALHAQIGTLLIQTITTPDAILAAKSFLTNSQVGRSRWPFTSSKIARMLLDAGELDPEEALSLLANRVMGSADSPGAWITLLYRVLHNLDTQFSARAAAKILLGLPPFDDPQWISPVNISSLLNLVEKDPLQFASEINKMRPPQISDPFIHQKLFQFLILIASQDGVGESIDPLLTADVCKAILPLFDSVETEHFDPFHLVRHEDARLKVLCHHAAADPQNGWQALVGYLTNLALVRDQYYAQETKYLKKYGKGSASSMQATSWEYLSCLLTRSQKAVAALYHSENRAAIQMIQANPLLLDPASWKFPK